MVKTVMQHYFFYHINCCCCCDDTDVIIIICFVLSYSGMTKQVCGRSRGRNRGHTLTTICVI